MLAGCGNSAFSALLIFPVKWIGPALGFAAVGPDAFSAAVILGALTMMAWKAREGREVEWLKLRALSEVPDVWTVALPAWDLDARAEDVRRQL